MSKIIFIEVLVLFLFTTNIKADNQSPEVTEHLGQILPLDLTFTNSQGRQVSLKNFINKPTVIDFVYYQCAGICYSNNDGIIGCNWKSKI